MIFFNARKYCLANLVNLDLKGLSLSYPTGEERLILQEKGRTILLVRRDTDPT